MTAPELDLDELEALEKAATPGPWVLDRETYVSTRYVSPDDDQLIADCDFVRPSSLRQSEANAAFIPAARNALPTLIARLRAAEARLQQLMNAYAALLEMHCSAKSRTESAEERVRELEAKFGELADEIDQDFDSRSWADDVRRLLNP